MRADMEEWRLRCMCISLAQKLPVQNSVLDVESMGRGGGGERYREKEEVRKAERGERIKKK
jgi:hypothetical protein